MGNILGYFLGYQVNFGKFVVRIFTVSGRIFPFTFTSKKSCDLNGRIFTPALHYKLFVMTSKSNERLMGYDSDMLKEKSSFSYI